MGILSIQQQLQKELKTLTIGFFAAQKKKEE
jgi:hypothetical protein